MKKSADQIRNLIKKAHREGYPQSLHVVVSKNQREVFASKTGKPYRYFDVASLTKIMVTVPLLMKMFEAKELRIEKKINHYLPYLKGALGGITVASLLVHHSGLKWWKPFYKKLLKDCRLEERQALMKKIMSQEKVCRTSHCIYSDLDFLILGWLAEELGGQSLDELASHFIFGPLKMYESFFLRSGLDRNFKKHNFAPTEINSLRGKIQGEVHDENAWTLGGVAGHAGLFCAPGDVVRFGSELASCYKGDSDLIVKSETLRKFAARAVPNRLGDWALGFMIPSRPISSAGHLVSSKAFGHTGFTGTSLWIDAKRDASIVILSNRTFPTRDDERFIALRREIHDAAWKLLDAEAK